MYLYLPILSSWIKQNLAPWTNHIKKSFPSGRTSDIHGHLFANAFLSLLLLFFFWDATQYLSKSSLTESLIQSRKKQNRNIFDWAQQDWCPKFRCGKKQKSAFCSSDCLRPQGSFFFFSLFTRQVSATRPSKAPAVERRSHLVASLQRGGPGLSFSATEPLCEDFFPLGWWVDLMGGGQTKPNQPSRCLVAAARPRP